MKKNAKNIVYIVIIIILIIILGIIIIKPIDFFGVSIFKIATGSMENEINIDDIVITKKEDNYEIGDIVAYKDKDMLIIHRIVKKNENNIITKGDANNVEDEPINPNQIIGKKVFLIKCGGTDAKKDKQKESNNINTVSTINNY